MSLEELKKKILQEALDKKDSLIASANIQAAKLYEQNIDKLKNEKHKSLEKVKVNKHNFLQREKSRLLLEHNRNIGKNKLEVLNNTLEDYAEYFINQEELYNQWLLLIVSNFYTSGDEITLTREKDREVLKKYRLSSEIRKGLGGIYIKKGRIEMNFTVEEFLRKIKNEKRLEIYDLLFPQSISSV